MQRSTRWRWSRVGMFKFLDGLDLLDRNNLHKLHNLQKQAQIIDLNYKGSYIRVFRGSTIVVQQSGFLINLLSTLYKYEHDTRLPSNN